MGLKKVQVVTGQKTALYRKGQLVLALMLLVSIFSLSTNNALAKGDKNNPPPPPPKGDKDAPHIQAELIIRMQAGYSISDKDLKPFKATLLDIIPDLNIYHIGYDPSQVEANEITQVQSAPGVQYIDLNYVNAMPVGNPWYGGQGFQTQYQQQYAITQTLGLQAQQLSTGAGVTVAVIDTGVAQGQMALASHLSNNGYDFITNNGSNYVDDPTGGPATGHGTGVAGLVLLVAPNSTIMPLRVLDQNGQGNLWNVLKALDYAANNGAKVINMSLGSTVNTNSLTDLVAYAQQKGAVVVASAGNDNANTLQYPCANSGVVCVAADDSNYVKASFSNYGSFVSVTAPGVALYTTYLNNSYATWSGTSMSSPLVAGGAALIISKYTTLTPAQISNRLETNTSPIYQYNSSYQGQLGSGYLNLYAALN